MSDQTQLESRSFTLPHLFAWCIAVWTVVCIAQHFVAWQPYVGDVDFFYYLCYSRDIARGVDDISDNRYAYFPGVYAFWSNVFRVVGSELATVQAIALSLLVLNGMLVGTIICRSTKSLLVASFSAFWYIVAATRFQGMTGVVEPLATIPLLVGVAIWNGSALTSANRTRSIILGLGIGLTVYTKQQAGLLSLGAIWLLFEVSRKTEATDSRRQQLLQLGVLPIVATLILIGLVALEGDGLRPITGGLATVSSYGTRDTPLKNVYAQFIRDPVTTSVLVLSLCSLFVLSWRTKTSPALRIVGFCLIASALSCVQFVSRAYHHYFLLALPGVIVGSVLLVAELKRLQVISQAVSNILLTVLFGSALLPRPSIPDAVHTLRIAGPLEKVEPLWFQSSDFEREVELLRAHVNPGERLQLLPPGQNYIHFQLDTISASPLGYSFRIPIDSLDWDAPVIVSKTGWQHAMAENGKPLDADLIRRIVQEKLPSATSVGQTFQIHRKASQ